MPLVGRWMRQRCPATPGDQPRFGREVERADVVSGVAVASLTVAVLNAHWVWLNVLGSWGQ